MRTRRVNFGAALMSSKVIHQVEVSQEELVPSALIF